MTITDPIKKILSHYEIMILDGAMATELEQHGLDLNDSLWSAKVLYEQPQAIYDVHYSYLKAGADCITTCSYQATLDGFIKKGFSHIKAVELIQKSADLARQAKQNFIKNEPLMNRPEPLVAASIGPYGAFLADGSEYRGNYNVSADVLRQFHLPRIEIMLDAGVDLLAFETIPSMLEIEVLLELLSLHPQAFAWFSLSIADPEHLCDGEQITNCVKLLSLSNQVAAVGVNCTSLENISPVIKIIKNTTDKPILVYPNSGETYNPVTKTWHGCGCNLDIGAMAKQWAQEGANLIGGCCRTTPKDIAKIAHTFREFI